MDTYNVMMSIQILSILLFFGLPYLARLIYLNTEAISFILFIVLFWLICSFVAIVSVYTWTAGFASWYCQWYFTTISRLIIGENFQPRIYLIKKDSWLGNPIMRNGKKPKRLRLKIRSLRNGWASQNRNTIKNAERFAGIKSGNDHRARWS